MLSASEARKQISNNQKAAEVKMKKVLLDNKDKFLKLTEKKIQKKINMGFNSLYLNENDSAQFYNSIINNSIQFRIEYAALFDEFQIFIKKELIKLGYTTKLIGDNYLYVSW